MPQKLEFKARLRSPNWAMGQPAPRLKDTDSKPPYRMMLPQRSRLISSKRTRRKNVMSNQERDSKLRNLRGNETRLGLFKLGLHLGEW